MIDTVTASILFYDDDDDVIFSLSRSAMKGVNHLLFISVWTTSVGVASRRRGLPADDPSAPFFVFFLSFFF